MNKQQSNASKAHNQSSVEFQSLEQRRMYAVDLAISAVSAGGFITSAGQSFDITYTLKNKGSSATTGTTYVSSVLTTDTIIGNADDSKVGGGSYKQSIPAGGTVTFTVKGGSGISQPAGSFRVGGVVDKLNLVPESNENNNTAVSEPGSLVIAEFLDHDSLAGTDGDDVIDLRLVSNRAIMVVNGQAYSRPIGFFADGLFIDCGPGNDKVSTTPDFNVALAITGGGGNDTIIGGFRDDELSGANGRDKIYGGAGWDYLLGGAGKDKLFGEAGRDTLSGAGGNDTLDAGTGTDKLLGGAGNDVLIANDGTADYRDSLSGNAGTDTAIADSEDVLAGIEIEKAS